MLVPAWSEIVTEAKRPRTRPTPAARERFSRWARLRRERIVHTATAVRLSFDPAKNERNIRDRGLSFELAAEFEFETATIEADSRRDYGEIRYVALGSIHGRLHVLCFTDAVDGIRVISLRKANEREVKLHAKTQATDR